MNGLFRIVFDFSIVRRAIIFNYGWAIHVSPKDHLDSIRRDGLIANRDAGIPDDLQGLVPQPKVLCMHPLGAKLCPPPVCNTIEYRPEIEMITLAVGWEDIPQRVHLDWSNAWPYQAQKIRDNYRVAVDEIVRLLLVDQGSFVSYDKIPPEKLRVLCEGCQPTNPLSWPALLSATKIATYPK
jgi:hypothetical protein